MNYDEMKRRVEDIRTDFAEIDSCEYMWLGLDRGDFEITLNPRSGPPISIPTALFPQTMRFLKELLTQRIQRLRDNIKIIEEMSDNVRLTAESGPMDSGHADSPDVI
jgi:hypothetical protein